ncbi:hypothetical protein B0O99DRAFT_688023 [Bisporella sp. PMI_857]|nr:hypothetical protein B0O99DRAFT_688023 [Bisporella sp. PMI_857]
MEVVGAVSAAIQITAFAVNVGQKIATFINDSREIEETNGRILSSARNLQEAVDEVHQVLERRRIQNGMQPLADDEIKMWEKIEKALQQANATIEILSNKIERLGGGKTSPGAWRKGWMQMKAQIQGQTISHIESQIDNNIKSLQLMIPCVQWFIHDETQEFMRAGFESMAKIYREMQDSIYRLEDSIQGHSMLFTGLSDGEEVFGDVQFAAEDLSGETLVLNSNVASECIDFAQSLIEKISKSGSVTDSSNQSQINQGLPLDHIPEAFSSNSSLRVITTGNNHITDPPQHARHMRKPYEGSDITEIEDEDILRDHIDNNYLAALESVGRRSFEKAESQIRAAIATAEQLETVYNFPFENRTEYSETLGHILTESQQFREAEHVYQGLLNQLHGRPSGTLVECRLRYALATLYKAEYRLHPRQDTSDRLLKAWTNHAILAHRITTQTSAGQQSDPGPTSRSHPTLRQTAEMMVELFTYKGMIIEANTYRQRYLNSPTRNSSSQMETGLRHTSLVTPPSPPDSESIPNRNMPRGSVVSEYSLSFPIWSRTNDPIMELIEMSDHATLNWYLNSSDILINTEQRNDKGQTLLLLAVAKRNPIIVRLFLEYKKSPPDTKAKDSSGNSVLHYALRGSKGEEIVEMLVTHGADVNAVTSDGTTPLHLAVENNKSRSLEILLDNKASLEAKDRAGRTAMGIAIKKKRHELVQILSSAGATLDMALSNDPAYKEFFKDLERDGIIPRPQTGSREEAPRRGSPVPRGPASVINRIFRWPRGHGKSIDHTS